MKRILACLLAMCSFLTNISSQTYTPSAENLLGRNDLQNMKFGMFIHWSIASLIGDDQWAMHLKNIHVNDYSKLINVFNPKDFNAKEWVALAKNSGMKYITFVSRHHDGFSNWDTKQSDWKITKTAFGRDVLKELAEECKKEGIKLFCYYSLLDWMHVDYQFETGRTGKGTGRAGNGKWENYISYMKGQLTELLTNYGEISGIWFDGHWDQTENDIDQTQQSKVNWHYDEIYKLIHRLQPQCLIANNHHLSPIPGEDFQTFEKDLPGHNSTGFGAADVSTLPLETCETMNTSWGYCITDRKYKTVKQLIQYMVNAAGHNANFLLNVGPMANGVVQQESIDTLKLVGNWMKQNGESIYGTRGNIVESQPWGVVTAKNQSLFVHLLKYHGNEPLFIPGIKQKISDAFLYAGKKKLKYKQLPEGLFVYLDAGSLDPIDTIIELKF